MGGMKTIIAGAMALAFASEASAGLIMPTDEEINTLKATFQTKNMSVEARFDSAEDCKTYTSKLSLITGEDVTGRCDVGSVLEEVHTCSNYGQSCSTTTPYIIECVPSLKLGQAC